MLVLPGARLVSARPCHADGKCSNPWTKSQQCRSEIPRPYPLAVLQRTSTDVAHSL